MMDGRNDWDRMNRMDGIHDGNGLRVSSSASYLVRHCHIASPFDILSILFILSSSSVILHS